MQTSLCLITVLACNWSKSRPLLPIGPEELANSTPPFWSLTDFMLLGISQTPAALKTKKNLPRSLFRPRSINSCQLFWNLTRYLVSLNDFRRREKRQNKKYLMQTLQYWQIVVESFVAASIFVDMFKLYFWHGAEGFVYAARQGLCLFTFSAAARA